MRNLISVGVCLILFALVIRGTTSSLRRQIARARQHERSTGESGESDRLAKQERALSRVSIALGVLGAALSMIGFVGS